MYRALAAQFATEQLDRPVGDDLVGIHVGGCTRTGLKDIEGEVRIEGTVDHLGSCLDDRLTQIGRNNAHLDVRLGTRTLDQAKSTNELTGKAHATDGEILDGALTLGAVQGAQKRLSGNRMVDRSLLEERF